MDIHQGSGPVLPVLGLVFPLCRSTVDTGDELKRIMG